MGGNLFHHIAHQALARRQPLADLGDKELKALIAHAAGRVLLGFGQRRRDGEIVTDKKTKRFQDDRNVAIRPGRVFGDDVQPAKQCGIGAAARLIAQIFVQRSINEFGFIATWPFAGKVKAVCHRIRNINRKARFTHHMPLRIPAGHHRPRHH